MFLDFFLLLKNDGFPVTIKEHLVFLEALDRDVAEYSPDDFYYLCRCSMVKHERHMDRFDRLFSAYFRGAQLADTDRFMEAFIVCRFEYIAKPSFSSLYQGDRHS